MEPNLNKSRGHIYAGIFLLVIGGLLLLRAFGMIFPLWLFTWPVILITIGLFIGLRHGFRGPAWIILVLIGTAFLLDRIIPGLSFHNFILPVVIIIIGIFFILRPRQMRHRRHRGWNEQIEEQQAFNEGHFQENTGPLRDESASSGNTSKSPNDFVDITTVFGGAKKIVLSKNFKGGDIMTFMGGAEVDLRQADFNGKISIDATNIFGGTKLIVPSTWDVQSEVVAIFGGVDDKRHINEQNFEAGKILRLDGTCLFGGIEIRSF